MPKRPVKPHGGPPVPDMEEILRRAILAYRENKERST